MPRDYTMAPSGDVIITLRNPNVPLDVGVESPSQPKKSESESGGNQANNDTSQNKSITYLVSSQHLILASPVFKAMLTGGWAEGNKKPESTVLHVDAEDWDAEAFTIAMKVLHGHCHQVPCKVSLELLGKLALIVDYYHIKEPFPFIYKEWISHVKTRLPVPNDLGRTLDLFMWVSFVLDDPVTFSQVTRVAILKGKEGWKPSENIPILQCVIDKINQKRRNAMGSIATELHRPRTRYSEECAGCNFACSVMQLGLLIRSLHQIKFWDHRTDSSESPFGNNSLIEVIKILAEMVMPVWSVPTTAYGSASKRHVCTRQADMAVFKLGVREDIKPQDNAAGSCLMADISDFLKGVKDTTMTGLRLGDYVKEADFKAPK
ncbi:hypothetical protein B0H66DRAFT_268385 [Apodospora peruviana]|uniref:BTB domain-containing protein n=1 Tax=Apodospora peruviana TaxID=516989 RepID=A0AAE0I6R8_9PEZI|nr:hypothetical protein B0H66DRAFT_268385 [Apodospora peruviana]